MTLPSPVPGGGGSSGGGNLLRFDISQISWGVVIIVLTVVISCGIFGWFMTKAMISAFVFPDPQPLAIALGLLTLIALLGALLTGNSEAYALAGTGIGAIAGAVTATWTRERKIPPGNDPPNQNDLDKEEP